MSLRVHEERYLQARRAMIGTVAAAWLRAGIKSDTDAAKVLRILRHAKAALEALLLERRGPAKGGVN